MKCADYPAFNIKLRAKKMEAKHRVNVNPQNLSRATTFSLLRDYVSYEKGYERFILYLYNNALTR